MKVSNVYKFPEINANSLCNCFKCGNKTVFNKKRIIEVDSSLPKYGLYVVNVYLLCKNCFEHKSYDHH